MHCAKHLALAFNNFAASFKIQHSSAFSGVPASLTPSILGALGFTVIMTIASAQFFKNRAWFLWALTTASILQCAGFIASAIHSHNGRNHLAFLASFGTVTLAPLLLSIAIFTTFGRLSNAVIPESRKSSRSAWIYFAQRTGSFVILPSLVPIAMSACAIVNIGKFLSPVPIDGRDGAFMRLLDYELGISQLEKAHACQALLCLVFGLFAVTFTLQGKSWKVDALSVRNKNWTQLQRTINVANAAMLFRACYKVYECRQIAASRASLGESGPFFWLCDVLPMVAALVVFCAVKPTSYLPESTPSIVLDPEALYPDEKAVPDYSGASF